MIARPCADLRELYDVLACEAIERWHAGGQLRPELRTVEALDLARMVTPHGAGLGHRRALC